MYITCNCIYIYVCKLYVCICMYTCVCMYMYICNIYKKTGRMSTPPIALCNTSAKYRWVKAKLHPLPVNASHDCPPASVRTSPLEPAALPTPYHAAAAPGEPKPRPLSSSRLAPSRRQRTPRRSAASRASWQLFPAAAETKPPPGAAAASASRSWFPLAHVPAENYHSRQAPRDDGVSRGGSTD